MEYAVSAIRTLIDDRGLDVGDRLPSERDRGETFSLSRNTVREAVRILKTYGVVEVLPTVGAIIVDRRMDAVFDLYLFSTFGPRRDTVFDTQGFRALEVESFKILSLRATAENIATLRNINRAMLSEYTAERVAQHDFRFHARLVAILGNKQIHEMYWIMRPVMRKIMENGVSRRNFRSQHHGEHCVILDALEGRDSLGAHSTASGHPFHAHPAGRSMNIQPPS